MARVSALIARLFYEPYMLGGVSYLLRRMGLTPQVPVRWAAERDEATIAQRRAVTWAKARG